MTTAIVMIKVSDIIVRAEINEDGSVYRAELPAVHNVVNAIATQFTTAQLVELYNGATRPRLDEGFVRVSSGRGGVVYRKFERLTKHHIVLHEKANGEDALSKYRRSNGEALHGELYYNRRIIEADRLALIEKYGGE